jgi:hypothetical protein
MILMWMFSHFDGHKLGHPPWLIWLKHLHVPHEHGLGIANSE